MSGKEEDKEDSPAKKAIKNVANPSHIPALTRGLSMFDPVGASAVQSLVLDDIDTNPEHVSGVHLLRQSSLEASVPTVIDSGETPESPSNSSSPEQVQEAETFYFLRQMPQWTFVFPNLSAYSNDIRDFVRKDLFQLDHIKALENGNGRVINWDPSLTRLIPLKTQGDGNCLLHAVSLGMWGVHDRKLFLRKALHLSLTGTHCARFCERWRHVTGQGLAEESKWGSMWDEIVQHSGTELGENRFGGKANKLEFLEQLHILVLANMLRRPILVYVSLFI